MSMSPPPLHVECTCYSYSLMVATQKFSMIPSFPIQKFLGLDVMLPQPIGADKHL